MKISIVGASQRVQPARSTAPVTRAAPRRPNR